VRAVSDGKIIAKIPPPAKGSYIEGVAAAPGNRIFYLAAETSRPTGGQIAFYRVVLGKDGRPAPASRVPGAPVSVPGNVASDGLIGIPLAVSPDGQQIAYVTSSPLLLNAGGRPATITVRKVLTGASRGWSLWPTGRTAITEVSWAADGQLCFTATIGRADVSHDAVREHNGTELSVIMLLNTLEHGQDLAADSRLISYGELSESATGASSVLEGPVAAVVAGHEMIVAQLNQGPRSAKLVEISAATGKVTRVLLSGPPVVLSQPEAADGDNVLFTLSPRRLTKSGLYVCGHLADAQVSSSRITTLPFPVYCSTVAPPPPFQATW
jgi:hypothetical protein